MAESKTLRDWRELRGLTVEELADMIGQDSERVERWEELGWDWEPYTSAGDAEDQEVINSLFAALGIEGGIAGVHAPPAPEPGQYVVDPAKLPEDMLRFLVENAEEVGVRVSLPSRWGAYLKAHAFLEPADLEALEAHYAGEAEHSARMGAMLSNIVARLEEHGGQGGDKVGDVLEGRGGKLVPRRQPPEDQE
jgi:transcriptional regulator with XRE-family HTH domain